MKEDITESRRRQMRTLATMQNVAVVSDEIVVVAGRVLHAGRRGGRLG